MIRFLLAASTALFLIASPAFAQTLDSSHRDWSVYQHNGTCYMGSAPTGQTGNYSRRGEPYVLIVRRGSNAQEINASSGYPYKGDVALTIDGKKFSLFSEGGTAWAKDGAADANIVKAMKAGSRMQLRGTSQKDTWSEDTYSLMGFSAAFARMNSLCK